MEPVAEYHPEIERGSLGKNLSTMSCCAEAFGAAQILRTEGEKA